MTMRRTARIAIVAALGLALWSAAPAWGNIYTVTPGSSDVADVNTGDAGVCDADPTAGVVCTLRAAVQTANSAGSPGFDTIQVPGGNTFTLTITNSAGDENAAAQGDLDLTTNMEIVGTGGTATITGNTPTPPDRIFDVPSGNPTVTLRNLTITNGQPANGGNGGGVRQQSGSLTIDSSSVSGSATAGPSDKGGGIYSNGATSLTVTDTTVNGNHAALFNGGGQGGGIYTATPATITRSTIYNNAASFGCGASLCSGYGAGIFIGDGTLTNVTISGNWAYAQSNGAAAGGGLVAGGTVTVINSTIASNTASGSVGLGGGNIDSAGLTLENTIVADGSTPDKSGTENCSNDTGSPTSFVSFGHNLEARSGQAASQCGLSPGVNGDITAANSGLDALGLYGGPTRTHRLQATSPAVDAGGPNGPATDQRGVSRPQGTRCDIGAYELDQAGGTPAGYTCAGAPAPPGSGGGTTPAGTAALAGPTGLRAAALKKCKKKKRAARAKCKKKANLLPL
jgi:hypothetical protein